MPAGAANFNKAIRRLKAKYPHRGKEIDFVVSVLPELGSIPWQQLYASVKTVIEREERDASEKPKKASE